ncbi:hypothetical protein QBC38DRAFT_458526 [Podospora fimiseda]|uniref:Uncharacterized protein n=1 Tax=Podospora fimiseda TaxID=252190 RepID=A0AAN7BIW7_9PEZI|nr:hypothetical protein QBC38DRAFT_458526 [Podospora fimiseda]
MRLLASPEGQGDRIRTWDCTIVESPSAVPELAQHQVNVPQIDMEIANEINKDNKERLPLVLIKFSPDLDECRRLVQASCDFLPDAWRINLHGHRDLETIWCLIRGVGFFDVLVKPRLGELSLTSTPRSVQVVNLLAWLKQHKYKAAIFDQMPEHDYKPFEAHLSHAHLGLVPITTVGCFHTHLVAASGPALQASFSRVLC